MASHGNQYAGSPEAKVGVHTPDAVHQETVDGNSVRFNEKKDVEGNTEELEDDLPTHLAPILELGIENWQQLEKKLVRRLDMTLMPCLWVLYLFNYLDRASIAQSRISTLDQDLNLTGSQFSTAVSILFVGYITMQLPSNMIIGFVRPSIYLPACAILWSGVSAATAGVTNYQGLVAVRFFLGVVEAPLFPGAMFVMASWYTRAEIALRVAVLFTGLSLANAISGLIAAAVFATLEQTYGLAGWQWLFIVLAVTGCGLALICMVLLPDYPHSTTGSSRWTMTEDMRRLAVARMAADRVSMAEGKTGIWNGLKMCLRDWNTWILVFCNIAISGAYGFSNFFPAIVRGFGYESRVITLVLTAPPYIVAAIGGMVNSWHSNKSKERGFHFSVPVAIGCAGYIICLGTTNTAARYAAGFMYVGGMFTAYPLLHTWTAITLSRTPEKKAISLAVVNILGNIGNMTSPYFFLKSDEPRYLVAFIMMLILGLISIGFAMYLKARLFRANKKLLVESIENRTAYQPYGH